MTRSSLLAAIVAFAPACAAAQSCPAEQMRPDVSIEGPTENIGVTVANGEAVSLTEATGLNGVLQERLVTIMPGGVLEVHAHADMPGYAYVLSGTALEHRSDCAVPIRRTVGDTATEPHTVTHWWQNDGDEPFVLFVSHVVKNEQGNED